MSTTADQFGQIVRESKALEKKIRQEMAAFELKYGCTLVLEKKPTKNLVGTWSLVVAKDLDSLT